MYEGGGVHYNDYTCNFVSVAMCNSCLRIVQECTKHMTSLMGDSGSGRPVYIVYISKKCIVIYSILCIFLFFIFVTYLYY